MVHGSANIKGVILTKMQEKGYVFLDKNARERVRFGAENELLDDNSQKIWRYVPFFSNFVQKRVLFDKICKAKSVFPPKNARERVSFSRILQEKGYGFRGRVGTPAYNN